MEKNAQSYDRTMTTNAQSYDRTMTTNAQSYDRTMTTNDWKASTFKTTYLLFCGCQATSLEVAWSWVSRISTWLSSFCTNSTPAHYLAFNSSRKAHVRQAAISSWQAISVPTREHFYYSTVCQEIRYFQGPLFKSMTVLWHLIKGLPRVTWLTAVLAPSSHVSSSRVSPSGICGGQNEMDRIVPKGFDISRLNIIPSVLHSHFLSPELY
jgi:hypothetical protein